MSVVRQAGSARSPLEFVIANHSPMGAHCARIASVTTSPTCDSQVSSPCSRTRRSATEPRRAADDRPEARREPGGEALDLRLDRRVEGDADIPRLVGVGRVVHDRLPRGVDDEQDPADADAPAALLRK